MNKVGIRELRQNASSVVASASTGNIITITDRGRSVARLTPLGVSPLQAMIDSGRARPPKRALWESPPPEAGPRTGPSLSDDLVAARAAERS